MGQHVPVAFESCFAFYSVKKKQHFPRIPQNTNTWRIFSSVKSFNSATANDQSNGEEMNWNTIIRENKTIIQNKQENGYELRTYNKKHEEEFLHGNYVCIDLSLLLVVLLLFRLLLGPCIILHHYNKRTNTTINYWAKTTTTEICTTRSEYINMTYYTCRDGQRTISRSSNRA